MRQSGLILAAGRVSSKKKKIGKNKKQKIRPTPNTARNPQQPGDRVQLEAAPRKHVPRVRLYSPASIDPELVEIGLVQLSQFVKTTNVTHTDRHRQTD